MCFSPVLVQNTLSFTIYWGIDGNSQYFNFGSISIYIYIYVPDQVVTLAQDGTGPNMGWPNKELTTLSLLRPKIP